MLDHISPVKGVYLDSNGMNTRVGRNATDLGKQFGNMLQEAIHNLNAEQKHVDQLNHMFLSGQMQNVEELLIAGQKSSLHLELTVQIRNKVIEAYQEIMRTQI